MQLFVFALLGAAVTEARGFFFSPYQSSTVTDCAWLPWQYIACIRSGNQFRKVENRTKIALSARASCNSEIDSRTTESCSAAEYVASTVLSTISNRRTKENSDVEYVYTEVAAKPWRPNRGVLRISKFDKTPTSESRHCGSSFTDPDTGIKMLGADCATRHRRSIETTEVKSRQKRQFSPNGVSSINHRDILFLLDESGSVGHNNFKMEIEFVEALAEKLAHPREIGRTATRVAVTTFSRNQAHRIDFLDSNNLRNFKNALEGVSYRAKYAGSTCLIDALRSARNEVFTTSGGSRVPSKTADGLIILVTDGCLNCRRGDVKSILQTEQRLLEKKGISILTFMVNVGGRCESIYKALQDGSSCFQGYSYPSWSEFEKLVTLLRTMEGNIDHWTKNNEQCP